MRDSREQERLVVLQNSVVKKDLSFMQFQSSLASNLKIQQVAAYKLLSVDPGGPH